MLGISIQFFNFLSAAAGAIVKYVSQRAGIGVNAGKIRALGSPIRGGEAMHTGCIPFYVDLFFPR
jgi:ribonucleoside-diphosphate reductase alpha chain